MFFFNLKKLIFKYYKYLIIILLSVLCLIYFIFFYKSDEVVITDVDNNISRDNSVYNSETIINETNNKIKVDIKGAVNNPGVYEIEENSRVNDLILLAGGLTESANTEFINLSKMLEDEMVVIIYTNEEIKTSNETFVKYIEKECICPDIKNDVCISDSNISDNKNDLENNNSSNSVININEANLEELMTLNGIGETKAKSIIEYRGKNGRFNNINDITNVNGIGNSTFEKIKDNITT